MFSQMMGSLNMVWIPLKSNPRRRRNVQGQANVSMVIYLSDGKPVSVLQANPMSQGPSETQAVRNRDCLKVKHRVPKTFQRSKWRMSIGQSEGRQKCEASGDELPGQS